MVGGEERGSPARPAHQPVCVERRGGPVRVSLPRRPERLPPRRVPVRGLPPLLGPLAPAAAGPLRVRWDGARGLRVRAAGEVCAGAACAGGASAACAPHLSPVCRKHLPVMTLPEPVRRRGRPPRRGHRGLGRAGAAKTEVKRAQRGAKTARSVCRDLAWVDAFLRVSGARSRAGAGAGPAPLG